MIDRLPTVQILDDWDGCLIRTGWHFLGKDTEKDFPLWELGKELPSLNDLAQTDDVPKIDGYISCLHKLRKIKMMQSREEDIRLHQGAIKALEKAIALFEERKAILVAGLG